MKPKIEQEIASQLRWRSLAEVPGCPAANYRELLHKSDVGELFVAVNYTAANQLARYIFGTWNSFVGGFISWIPFLTALALIPVAVIVGEYWMLGGIPLALFAMFFSNPINPAKRFASVTGVLGTLAVVWFWSEGDHTAGVIAASYAVPFWAIRYLYYRNSTRLAREALRSEPLLLFLLQNGHACIRDTSSGETFWGPSD